MTPCLHLHPDSQHTSLDMSTACCCVQIARCVIGVVVVGHYPLNHHPARQGYEDLLIAMFGFTVLPSWVSMLCTIVFVASSVAVSLVVSTRHDKMAGHDYSPPYSHHLHSSCVLFVYVL